MQCIIERICDRVGVAVENQGDFVELVQRIGFGWPTGA